MALVVPHGVLFRGAAERRIRQALIEENLLDAVIGLPGNLFQTTSIPVAILAFDRSREKGGNAFPGNAEPQLRHPGNAEPQLRHPGNAEPQLRTREDGANAAELGLRAPGLRASTKSFTGRWALAHNAELGLRVPGTALWMPDYWDRFIRNEDHLQNTIDYIQSSMPVLLNSARRSRLPFPASDS